MVNAAFKTRTFTSTTANGRHNSPPSRGQGSAPTPSFRHGLSARVHSRVSFTFQNMAIQKYNKLLSCSINVPIRFQSVYGLIASCKRRLWATGAVLCLLSSARPRDAQGRKGLPPGAERSDKEVVWSVALDWSVCISKVCSQSSHLLFLGIRSRWEGQSLPGP